MLRRTECETARKGPGLSQDCFGHNPGHTGVRVVQSYMKICCFTFLQEPAQGMASRYGPANEVRVQNETCVPRCAGGPAG